MCSEVAIIVNKYFIFVGGVSVAKVFLLPLSPLTSGIESNRLLTEVLCAINIMLS